MDRVAAPRQRRADEESEDDPKPKRKQAARLAARWCASLFPGHEAVYDGDLTSPPASEDDEPEPGGASSPLPSALAVEEVTGAAPDTPRSAAPVTPFAWNPAALTSAVRQAVDPPVIDLSDWRSWFAEAPAARVPERNLPVDLGPAPERPGPEPEPVRNELAELLDAALELAEVGAAVVPEPERNLPVDLGPAPARPEPPPPIPRNQLAELIRSAAVLVVNDQPEPDPPPSRVADLDSVPSLRLDVADVRRAVREARF